MLYLRPPYCQGRFLQSELIHLRVLDFLEHHVVVYLHNELLRQVYHDHKRELHQRFQQERLYFQIRVFPSPTFAFISFLESYDFLISS